MYIIQMYLRSTDVMEGTNIQEGRRPTHNISHLSHRAELCKEVLGVDVVICGWNVPGTLGKVPNHMKFGFFSRSLLLNVY